MPRSPRVTTLSISSHPRELRTIRRWVAGIAIAEGLEPSEAREVAAAVNEACANVHRHAYDERDDGRLDLEVEAGDDGLRISVRDYGAPFDPRTYVEPDLDRPREGGYGVFLMRAWMDAVEYRDAPGGTRVVLTRKRRGTSRGARSIA